MRLTRTFPGTANPAALRCGRVLFRRVSPDPVRVATHALIVRSAAPGGFGRCPDSGAQAVMGLRQPGGSRLRFRIHAAVHGRDQIHFLWIAWVTLAISTL